MTKTQEETQTKKVFKNPFHAFKNRTIIQRIAITGVFFGLVILFQYLEHFMPFGATFLKFNLSLLFILPIFYFAGPLLGATVILLRFVIGPSMDGLGYTSLGLTGQAILLISTLSTIGFMYLFSWVFRKIDSHNKKIIYISISTVISATIFLTFLNMILFTPMYFYAYVLIPTKGMVTQNMFDISGAIDDYTGYKNWDGSVGFSAFYFGIKNYWLGILAVFIPGNLIKFTIVYVIYYPLSKAINHFMDRVGNSWGK